MYSKLPNLDRLLELVPHTVLVVIDEEGEAIPGARNQLIRLVLVYIRLNEGEYWVIQLQRPQLLVSLVHLQ